MARGDVGAPPEVLQEAAEPVLARLRADIARVPPVPIGKLLRYLGEHLFDEGLTIQTAKTATGVRGNRVVDLCRRQLGCPPRRYLDDRRAEIADRLRERMPELSLERIAEAIGFKTAAALSAVLGRWRARRASEQESSQGELEPSSAPEPPSELLALSRSPAERVALEKDFARKVTLKSFVRCSQSIERWQLRSSPRGPALFRALLRVSREGCRDDRKLGVEVANEALEVLRRRCRHLSEEERASLEIEGLVWLGHACRLAIDLPGAHAALRDARAVLEKHSGSAKELVQVLALESRIAIFERRYDDALVALGRAIELQEEIGEPVSLSRLLLSRGFVWESRDEFDLARCDLERARELISGTGDRFLSVALASRSASLELAIGDLERADQSLTVARQVARQLGNRTVWHQLWWLEGLQAQARGDLRRAEERFVAARVGFQSTEDLVPAGVVALDHAILCAEAGKLAEVPTLVAEVLPIVEALNFGPYQAEALRLLHAALDEPAVNPQNLKEIRDQLAPNFDAPRRPQRRGAGI